MSTAQRTRVIVIGLDGGTWRLLGPMMDNGRMPHMARLTQGGVWGELASTVPPVTAPAWATFSTGTNPGKHGVFDFQIQVPGQEKRVLISSQDVRGPKFWELGGKEGIRTGLINLPLTYPPEPIQGFVISGMLTPDLESSFTFPPTLQEQVFRVAPEYVTDVDLLTSDWHYYGQASLHALVARLSAALEQRHLLVKHLVREQQWDVLVFVMTELDRAQHLLFKLLVDPDVPGAWADLRRQTLDLYHLADDTIGSLCEMTDDRTTVFIVSDHGFGPLDKRINLNAWLSSQGWLEFSGGKSLLRKSLKWVVKASGLDRWIPQHWRQSVRQDLSVHSCIDWSATTAYSGTPLEQGIRINLQGREPWGIVEPGLQYEDLCEQIAQKLLCIQDPARGTPIVDRVYRREELYQGPEAARAPDLIFSLGDYRCIPSEGLPDQPLFETFPFPWAGYHNPQGIFAVAGHCIESSGHLDNIHIADIAPTILHLLGVPVPCDMDGRVLSELLSADWLTENPIEYQADETADVAWGTQQVYTENDFDRVEDRLRGLGYLG